LNQALLNWQRVLAAAEEGNGNSIHRFFLKVIVGNRAPNT
jgi:hypothetical protein